MRTPAQYSFFRRPLRLRRCVALGVLAAHRERLGGALAGLPDLECDDLVSCGVVIDQAPIDLNAYDILGVAGGQPRDVGVAIIVGVARVHGLEDSLRAAE
jgi:hypothetical protein